MKKFFAEFAKFIKRGSVMDLAVGIIIGAAFKDIINSMVNDILMPIIGLVFRVDIKSAVIIMRGGIDKIVDGVPIYLEGTVLLRWGSFMQAVLDFLIIAFVIFSIIKLLNGLNDRAKKRKDKYIAKLEKKKAKGVKLSKIEQDLVDALASDLEPKEVIVEEPKPTVEELLGDIKELLAKQQEVK